MGYGEYTGNDNYFVVLEVPAVNRPKEKVEPPDPPSEIRVDW